MMISGKNAVQLLPQSVSEQENNTVSYLCQIQHSVVVDDGKIFWICFH